MDLCRNLENFYKICRFTGLIQFKFNKNKQKFERSVVLTIVSTAVVGLITFLNGLLLFQWITCYFYVALSGSKMQDGEDERTQDHILRSMGVFICILCTSLYGWTCLRHRRAMLSIVNEVLKIYKCLTPLTSPHLFITSTPAYLFSLKLVISFLQTSFFTAGAPFTIITIVPIILIITPTFALRLGMSAGYMYLQMVLIVFYSKMNIYLETVGIPHHVGTLIKNLQKFPSISRRIQRVKRQSDEFFSLFFVVTFLGLIADIEKIYEMFVVLLYSKYNNPTQDLWEYMKDSYKFICIAYTLDVYLINFLSETLVACEEEFQRKVFLISLHRPVVEEEAISRNLDVMVFQRQSIGVRTLAFNSIPICRDTAFRIIMAIVVGNVITCLQLYAGQEIYKKQSN